MALVLAGKVSLQAAIGIKSPLATVALKFDVSDLGPIVVVLRVKLLEMSLGIKLKSKDGRAQVTLVSLDFLGRLFTSSW